MAATDLVFVMLQRTGNRAIAAVRASRRQYLVLRAVSQSGVRSSIHASNDLSVPVATKTPKVPH
jgi:hypothetical protein